MTTEINNEEAALVLSLLMDVMNMARKRGVDDTTLGVAVGSFLGEIAGSDANLELLFKVAVKARSE